MCGTGKNGVRLNMNIGENIKQLRKNKGLTQKELGELIGVKAITIRKYESNEREPNIETLNKIAMALGVTINDLVKNEEKASNKNSIGIRFLDRSKLPDEKEQIIKVVEEMYEFINATGDENQLEEFYDLVQASLNLLQIRNFTLQEIQEAEKKHIEKLRKRGWNI